MPFSIYEINTFQNHIRSENESEMLVEQNLDDDTYALFRSRGMLHLLNDRIHVPKVKQGKHNSITMTKFLSPDISISSFIDQICGSISREYELKIDFGFMAEKTDEDGESTLQYCWPQRSTFINPVSKIFTIQDRAELRNFLKTKSHNDFLNLTYLTSNEFCAFDKSGYRPYRLLTLTLYITK